MIARKLTVVFWILTIVLLLIRWLSMVYVWVGFRYFGVYALISFSVGWALLLIPHLRKTY